VREVGPCNAWHCAAAEEQTRSSRTHLHDQRGWVCATQVGAKRLRHQVGPKRSIHAPRADARAVADALSCQQLQHLRLQKRW
jgi:hypothetical protein